MRFWRKRDTPWRPLRISCDYSPGFDINLYPGENVTVNTSDGVAMAQATYDGRHLHLTPVALISVVTRKHMEDTLAKLDAVKPN